MPNSFGLIPGGDENAWARSIRSRKGWRTRSNKAKRLHRSALKGWETRREKRRKRAAIRHWAVMKGWDTRRKNKRKNARIRASNPKRRN